MYEAAGYEPRVGDLTSTETTLAPEVLARLAAMASQLATQRSFLPFVPQQQPLGV